MENRKNEFEDGAVSFSEWQGNDGGKSHKGKKNKNTRFATTKSQ